MSTNNLKKRIEKLEKHHSELTIIFLTESFGGPEDRIFANRSDTGQEWLQGEDENLEAFEERINKDLEGNTKTGIIVICERPYCPER